mmetsp:Transcript_15847/g.33705  ORF Transcript_15847/g.33705 Transcript_15847/m.33705 type:complete len:344 (-) Transcript_15847:185-1216(-)
MAFNPGFVEAIEKNQIERIETDSDGNEEIIKPRIGNDVVIGGQEPWKLCEMTRRSDTGWEAAMGSFYLTEHNQYGLPCSKHFWAIKFLKCDSCCWRIGLATENFPVSDLWSQFELLELGAAPPWAVFLAGGQTKVTLLPSRIKASGSEELQPNVRRAEKNGGVPGIDLKKSPLDRAGRLRLAAGDVIGISVDIESKGRHAISFFVNGVLMHETIRLQATTEIGALKRCVPWVCLGNTRVRVRMLRALDAPWQLHERQDIVRADLALAAGKPEFPGRGWVWKESRVSGGLKRCWFEIDRLNLIKATRPVVIATVHRASGVRAAGSSQASVCLTSLLDLIFDQFV